MIEGYAFVQEKWYIRSTNQTSFNGGEDRIYFTYRDSMGHEFWYRMPEDDWYEQRDKEFLDEQRKDYDIMTGPDGLVSKTPHTICGRCGRCKTCGDCICDDKHEVK